jgi:membrane protein implicated in regulation of membrane protease activity
MPGGNRIEPNSFIMSAVMFFILAGFLLLIPDQSFVLMTTNWGPLGPKQFAAVAFILGLLSLLVWPFAKKASGKRREE